jgi:hypothetical protein
LIILSQAIDNELPIMYNRKIEQGINKGEKRMVTYKMFTKDLKAGQVMHSGEVVVSAIRPNGTTFYGNPKMHVTLENPTTKNRRFAMWHLYGTVYVKGEYVQKNGKTILR